MTRLKGMLTEERENKGAGQKLRVSYPLTPSRFHVDGPTFYLVGCLVLSVMYTYVTLPRLPSLCWFTDRPYRHDTWLSIDQKSLIEPNSRPNKNFASGPIDMKTAGRVGTKQDSGCAKLWGTHEAG